MGAVCAVVYLLIIIVFIPFPFYKDIVAATSGGGNRDVLLDLQQVETGRLLHRFPHSKACFLPNIKMLDLSTAANEDYENSWHSTYLPSCPYNLSFFSVSVTIFSIYVGATNFSSLLSRRSRCWWYILSTSV